MTKNHTNTKRLAALGLVFTLLISSLAMIAPPASAATGEPTPYDFKRTVNTPAIDHNALLQWMPVTDDAPNLARIIMVDGTLYATSKDGRFYSSVNGADWTLLYDFPLENPSSYVFDGNFLYYSNYWGVLLCAFAYGGPSGKSTGNLYMSTDLGSTWTVSDRIPHDQFILNDGMGESLYGTLYYGQYGGSGGSHGEYLADYSYIRKSMDGGQTWTTETSIYCTHIHSVDVAHDGRIFASYGDPHKAPYTQGLMVKENGVWKDVMSDLMTVSQPYSIDRIGDYTFFGSDSRYTPSIMRYDGSEYEASLHVMSRVSGHFDFSRDVMAADGVIYAMTYNPSFDPAPGGLVRGYGVWASPDMGDNWYSVYDLRYPQGETGPIGSSLAVDDGSPYGYVLTDDGSTVYRFNHLGQSGVHQLMYDGTYSSEEGRWSTSVTLANADVTIPIASRWMRDPVITVTARSMTNIFAEGHLDDLIDVTSYPLSYYRIDDLSPELDATTYTTAPQSLKIEGGNTKGFVEIKVDTSRDNAGKLALVVFDAKRDPSSDSCLLRAKIEYGATPSVVDKDFRFFALSDDWRTYTVLSERVAPDNYTNTRLIMGLNNAGDNQAAYIDNVRTYMLNPDEAVRMVPTGNSPAGVELQAGDVHVTIDGRVHNLGTGPYEDGDVIGTIQLTGDYKDGIDISAYCDGAVTITVEGERIGYANNLLPIQTDGGVWLRGGDADSYLELYGTPAIVYSGAYNMISPTGNAIYQHADGAAFITPTSWSMSSTAPATVGVLEWDSRSAQFTVQAPSGAQALTIGGLKSGSYLWYLDGVEQGEVRSEDGAIALSYTSTGLHSLEVVGLEPDVSVLGYVTIAFAAAGVVVLVGYVIAARHPAVLIVGIALLVVAALLKFGVL